MRETGIIISTNNQSAKILLSKGEKCAGCTACSAFGDNSMALEAQNKINAKTGDIVDVEVNPKEVVGLSILIFVFPILAMILGYFVGMRIGSGMRMSGENSGIIAAFASLIISFLIIKIYDKIWGHSGKSSAHIVGYSQLPTEDAKAAHSLARLRGADE